MYQVRRTVGGLALALLLWGGLMGPPVLVAQVVVPSASDGRWPLQANAPGNNTLAPFFEGWYANEDGTYSLSFGYVNINLDTLYIPLGENNFLDQAQFDGVQPTVFFPGRHRGVWSVTLPTDMEDASVWWTLTTQYGNVTRVPGRTSAVAYQLDWMPRPHGSVTPGVSFDSQSGVGRDLRASSQSVRRPWRLDLPSHCRSRRRTLRREIRMMPAMWAFHFAWCGPSFRVRDRWSTRGTSPTRSRKWTRTTTAPLPLFDDDVALPDRRLSGLPTGRPLPA